MTDYTDKTNALERLFLGFFYWILLIPIISAVVFVADFRFLMNCIDDNRASCKSGRGGRRWSDTNTTIQITNSPTTFE